MRAERPRTVTQLDDEPYQEERAQREAIRARAEAYAQVMPAGSFFCGRTAAVLMGGPVRHGAELEVAVIDPARAPRGHGIRGRKVMRHLVRVTEADGLLVAAPESVWAMLGREMSVRDLVRVGDSFVRVPRDDRGTPRPEAQLITIDALLYARSAGRREGLVRLDEALGLIRVGAMSPLETDMRLEIVAAGLPEPSLDLEVTDARGTILAIADAAYPRYSLVLEAEGDHHRTERRQWVRDIDRTAALTAAGWEVVRLTATHIRSGRAVQIVRDALTRHGWH